MNTSHKKQKGKPAPGSVTGKETKLIRASNPKPPKDPAPPDLPTIIALSKRFDKKKVLALGEESDSEAEVKEDPPSLEDQLLRNMVRSIFKADKPYRCNLGYHSTIATSAAGLTNNQWPVSAISSSSEWGSIDVLFNEVFIHSMTFKFYPRNRLDGSFAFTPAGQTAPVIETTGASTTTTIWNAGLIMVSMFAGSGSYGNSSGMVANPNHKTAHTSKPFKYVWRNNVRFDPRGASIPTSQTSDWMLISSVGSNYAGYIQFRTINDVTLGTGASAVTLGDVETIWDVSFRQRS